MKMKKFDIHCHVFKEKGFPREDGLFYLVPDEMLKVFEEKNVAFGTILPEVHYEGSMTGQIQRIEEVIDIVNAYPDKFCFFMNLVPHSFYKNPEADYSEMIEYYLNLGAKGVGEMCANYTFYDPLMDNVLFYVNKYKLPLIMHMTHNEFCDYGIRDDMELSGLERAAQKWPDITFLCHSTDFWNKISGEGPQTGYPTDKVAPGGRVVELMRKYPNIHGDLSAGSGLNAISRDREFGAKFLTEFQDKLYFGQDYCAPTNNMKHSEYLDELLESGEISQEVYNKVCWKNAVNLLKLDLTEEDFKM